MKSTIKTTAKVTGDLNQSTYNIETKKGRHSTCKRKLGVSLKTKWESKLLHGQYIRNVDRQLIGGEDTLLWVLRGDLKGETGNK
jgi:hypothetical protein